LGFWNDMDNNGGYVQFAPFAGVSEVPGRPGDANLDGRVAFDDLLTLAQNYGLSHGATWAEGDFDGSGAINFSNLLLLAQNYGQSSAAVSPVPEPVSAALLLVAAPALLRRRRTR
jgi:MYXO-CTERM domain-containing protein